MRAPFAIFMIVISEHLKIGSVGTVGGIQIASVHDIILGDKLQHIFQFNFITYGFLLYFFVVKPEPGFGESPMCGSIGVWYLRHRGYVTIPIALVIGVALNIQSFRQ